MRGWLKRRLGGDDLPPRYTTDLAPQVLRLECGRDLEDPTVSAVPRGLTAGGFVSGSLLAQKAKQFDDGLYAAVELAAQNGSGTFPGKKVLLASLGRALPALPDQIASTVILGAAELGGVARLAPPERFASVQATVSRFKEDSRRSKPVGFYTWTPELSAIFQQDRLLQTELRDSDGTEELARTLHRLPAERQTYERYLGLQRGLTNPSRSDDLRGLLQALDADTPLDTRRVHFFIPPSRAHETDLLSTRFGDPRDWGERSVIDELVEAVRSGTIVLTPGTDSGWYDYQTWAIEPLVLTEAMRETEKFTFDRAYADHLERMFKGLMALTRETHAKPLEWPTVGMHRTPPLVIRPRLSVEPLVTVYLRRAVSYVFVRRVLVDCFGNDGLAAMHRLTIDGPVRTGLADELDFMAALFSGAARTAIRELGFDHARAAELEAFAVHPWPSPPGSDADAAVFTSWAATMRRDVDLTQDARMMVPVYDDARTGKFRVWLFLGWASRSLDVSFVQPPRVKFIDGPDDVEFQSSTYELHFPVSAEVDVTELLDRNGFRAHCVYWRTPAAIVANLK
jgi:hypothetical protein